MQIHIKTLAGQLIPIEMDPLENGLVLREKIAEKIGGVPLRMSLVSYRQRDEWQEGEEISLFVQDEMVERCIPVQMNHHGEPTSYSTFHLIYQNGSNPWGTKLIVEREEQRWRLFPEGAWTSLDALFHQAHGRNKAYTDTQLKNMMHLLSVFV